MRNSPLPAPYHLAITSLLGLLCGVVGGYGGARLRARQLQNDLDQTEADHEGFDLRIKKIEGRDTRSRQLQRGPALSGDAELLAALQTARPKGGPAEGESEAALLASIGFLAPTRKGEE